MDTGFSLGNMKVDEHWEDLGIDGILKWIFKKLEERVWTRFIWLRTRTSDGNEHASPTKCGKYLDRLGNL